MQGEVIAAFWNSISGEPIVWAANLHRGT